MAMVEVVEDDVSWRISELRLFLAGFIMGVIIEMMAAINLLLFTQTNFIYSESHQLCVYIYRVVVYPCFYVFFNDGSQDC
jgi:hypothetical protein